MMVEAQWLLKLENGGTKNPGPLFMAVWTVPSRHYTLDTEMRFAARLPTMNH